MAHPGVRFRLTHNKKTALDLPASNDIRERAFQIYGSELSGNLMEFSGGRDSVGVRGMIARPSYTRADRTYQDFYVNGRPVKNASLTHALYQAFAELLMRDRHPVGFIFIDLDPALVDVNVHPAKAEVRFRNQSQLHDLVRDVIREGLRGAGRSFLQSSAEGVREAVTDYISNAEFGMRKESPLTPALSPEGRGSFSHPLPLGERTEVRGNSALLFPLAQVHDSFIVAQSNDGMALIDQHAAHERVLFEKLQDQYAGGNIPVQNLLIPVQVELGPSEKELLSEYLPELNGFGFIIENFGGNAFMIKAVPALMTGGDYKGLLLDITDELKIIGTSGKMDAFRDEVLSVMACHPAIKVHRRLSVPEMERLITDLFSCRMPHSCPHGRPTVVRFSMEEIKKMFKRI
jgi:DNA mismatch repair protein MutL